TALKTRRRKQQASFDKGANSTRHETQSGISAQEVMIKCGAGSRTRPGGSKTRLHTRPGTTPNPPPQKADSSPRSLLGMTTVVPEPDTQDSQNQTPKPNIRAS